MTKPTRADKFARIKFYSEWPLEDGDDPLDPDEMDLAILADYAPLTPERRTELKDRKKLLEGVLSQYLPGSLVKTLRTWLAEIDAELEGNDG